MIGVCGSDFFSGQRSRRRGCLSPGAPRLQCHILRRAAGRSNANPTSCGVARGPPWCGEPPRRTGRPYISTFPSVAMPARHSARQHASATPPGRARLSRASSRHGLRSSPARRGPSDRRALDVARGLFGARGSSRAVRTMAERRFRAQRSSPAASPREIAAGSPLSATAGTWSPSGSTTARLR